MSSEIIQHMETVIPGLPKGSDRLALERGLIIIKGTLRISEAGSLAQRIVAAKEMAFLGLESLDEELWAEPSLSEEERGADLLAAAVDNLNFLNQTLPFIKPIMELRPDVQLTWHRAHGALRERYLELTERGPEYVNETWFKGWKRRSLTPELMGELLADESEGGQIVNFALDEKMDMTKKIRQTYDLWPA